MERDRFSITPKRLEELNIKSIALNVLFVPYNIEKTRLAYKSKYNNKSKNQVILLMITDGNFYGDFMETFIA